MKRRFRCPIETKKEIVAEVVSGYRTEAVAKRYGMSLKTLSNWVRQYRDEVGDIMERKRKAEEQLIKDAERLKEIEKKYQEALKLLGEKDIEIQMLRGTMRRWIVNTDKIQGNLIYRNLNISIVQDVNLSFPQTVQEFNHPSVRPFVIARNKINIRMSRHDPFNKGEHILQVFCTTVNHISGHHDKIRIQLVNGMN